MKNRKNKSAAYRHFIKRNAQSREEKREIEDTFRWMKNVSHALKHAKKALKWIKKDGEGDCGFWHERYMPSGLKECCKAGGFCGHNDCPYKIAKDLVDALTRRIFR